MARQLTRDKLIINSLEYYTIVSPKETGNVYFIKELNGVLAFSSDGITYKPAAGSGSIITVGGVEQTTWNADLKQDKLTAGTGIDISSDNVISASGASVASAEFSSSNTQLNGLTINGTNYKLLDVKANDGSSLIIGNNRSLASGASEVVAIGDCDSATVSGYGSTAIGYSSRASNSYSTAIDSYSTASGNSSTAIGRYSKASGGGSIAIGYGSMASGNYSTALGYRSAVYVPSWIGFDGTTDDFVRTVALKSTDNVFFRNENIDTSKTTQASYTSGKTLTQVLSGKQDTLVSGASLSLNDTTLTLKNTAGTGISSVTLPTGIKKVETSNIAVGTDLNSLVTAVLNKKLINFSVSLTIDGINIIDIGGIYGNSGDWNVYMRKDNNLIIHINEKVGSTTYTNEIYVSLATGLVTSVTIATTSLIYFYIE